MDRLHLFFIANYLAQGLAGIVYEPLSYLLKDGMGLSSAESSVFVAWMTLPFLLKPLFGLITDFLAVRGLRRKPHIIAASVLGAASLLSLSMVEAPSYWTLLLLLILVNVGTVAGDVVCDAVMVEQGRPKGKTGLYQSVQIGVLYLGIVASGLGGGWLAAHLPPKKVFGLAALLPLIALASTMWVREPPAGDLPRRAGGALWSLLQERRFWALSLVIFLWSFLPFLGTVQFYYQSEALRLSPLFIGSLGTAAGLSGALGALFYGRVAVRRWPVETMVKAAVLLGAAANLSYLLYRGHASAMAVTALTGFAGVAFRLALMDLAARSSPEGCEATAFAAYMSVFGLAAWASNTAGGLLYEPLQKAYASSANPAHPAAASLIILGSLCTLACWPLLSPVLARTPSAINRPRRSNPSPA